MLRALAAVVGAFAGTAALALTATWVRDQWAARGRGR
jgi:hypothetical protein